MFSHFFNRWSTMAEMYTCNKSSCDLSSDGLTVTLYIPEANNIMNFAINVLNHYVIPQHDYTYYWLPNPVVISCDPGSPPLMTSGSIMPPWFYGAVTTDGAYDGDGNVVITAQLTNPIGQINEVSYDAQVNFLNDFLLHFSPFFLKFQNILFTP